MSKKNIKCDSCGTVTTVDAGDFQYTNETEERSMGKHTETWGEVEFECSSQKCTDEIKVETNTTEYPEGDFQEGETSVTGGTEV